MEHGRRHTVTALVTWLFSGALALQAHHIGARVLVPDPIVVTNARDAGAGSLRQAMLSANATADPDTITFAISGPGPFVIALQTPLPAIAYPTVIDGLTQAGAKAQAPQVFLDGEALRVPNGKPAPGFEIVASGTTIRGLGIRQFPGPGVSIARAGSPDGGNAVIAQNTISHNGGPGISVRGGDATKDEPSSNVTITENAIFENTGIGIDQGGDGPTPNQPAGGPNYPSVIAVTNGKTTSLDFTVDGPAGTYTIEFFSGSSCGAAERMVAGSSEAVGRHRVDLGVLLPIDTWVVATATNEAGNTSELSACGQIRQGPAFTWWMSQGPGDVTTTDLGRDNGVAEFTYKHIGDRGEWRFTTVAGGVAAISLHWSWTGSHSSSQVTAGQVTAGLDVFVSRDGKDVSVVQLIDEGPADCCVSPSKGFTYKGTTTVVVGAGDTYGFRLRGSHHDAADTLQGTFEVIVGIDGGSAVLEEAAPTRARIGASVFRSVYR